MKGMTEMSKLFMRGTRLETSEVMMMSIPNFNKSSDTTYLMKNTQKQIAQSGKCRYCTAFTKTRTCKHDCCPYMMQRIHMGSVSYETVMNDCFRDVTTRGMKKGLKHWFNISMAECFGVMNTNISLIQCFER